MKSPISSKPDFIVPGFPKAGTTWLYDRLRELPDFAMPTGKELHFFNRHPGFNADGAAGRTRSYPDLRKLFLRNFGLRGLRFFAEYLRCWERNETTYLRIFSQQTGITGDVTPTYCLLPEEGVRKIATLRPDLKIVFLLRDPVERAWSQFRMHLRNNGKSFEQLDEQEIHDFITGPLMDRRGRYQTAVKKYERHFPSEQISVHFYDLLQTDPAAFLAGIVSFLGGDPAHVEPYCALRKVANPTRKIPIPSAVRALLRERYREETAWAKSRFPEPTRAWE